jgi:hypothetical protein
MVRGLVTIPESWCERLADSMETEGLPVDLFSIPEVNMTAQVDGVVDAKEDGLAEGQKKSKCKWGPTLVDKRPSRSQKDGRTILEKAQERKKITNLEKNKGKAKSHNAFAVLSSDEICHVADLVGVSLGDNPQELNKSVSGIIDLDIDRVSRMSKECGQCSQVVDKGTDQSPGLSGQEGDALMTPTGQLITSQLEGDDAKEGQWTLVVNRKKSKSRFVNEGSNMEC